MVSSRMRRAYRGSVPNLNLRKRLRISLYGRCERIPEPTQTKSYSLRSNFGWRMSSARLRTLTLSQIRPFLSKVLLNLSATFPVLPVHEEYRTRLFLATFTPPPFSPPFLRPGKAQRCTLPADVGGYGRMR